MGPASATTTTATNARNKQPRSPNGHIKICRTKLDFELNEEAEDDVFIASFHMPETQPGSAPQAEESPAGQTLPRGDQQGDVNMAGAAPELVPQGTATEPAAEGQSSNAPEPDADESSDESEECAMEAENQKEEQQVPLRSGPRGRSGCAILSPAGRRGAIEALRAMRLKELKKASQGQKLEIQLGQIRYSQDSIMGVFKEGRKLKETRLDAAMGPPALTCSAHAMCREQLQRRQPLLADRLGAEASTSDPSEVLPKDKREDLVRKGGADALRPRERRLVAAALSPATVLPQAPSAGRNTALPVDTGDLRPRGLPSEALQALRRPDAPPEGTGKSKTSPGQRVEKSCSIEN
eukprot:g30633.t1